MSTLGFLPIWRRRAGRLGGKDLVSSSGLSVKGPLQALSSGSVGSRSIAKQRLGEAALGKHWRLDGLL
jgi:hypothetical protein